MQAASRDDCSSPCSCREGCIFDRFGPGPAALDAEMFVGQRAMEALGFLRGGSLVPRTSTAAWGMGWCQYCYVMARSLDLSFNWFDRVMRARECQSELVSGSDGAICFTKGLDWLCL